MAHSITNYNIVLLRATFLEGESIWSKRANLTLCPLGFRPNIDQRKHPDCIPAISKYA